MIRLQLLFAIREWKKQSKVNQKNNSLGLEQTSQSIEQTISKTTQSDNNNSNNNANEHIAIDYINFGPPPKEFMYEI